MKDLTDGKANEEYLLSKGWEIFEIHMEPDAPEKVRHIQWWLRLDGIPTKNLLFMDWYFAYNNVEIHRDYSYIRNVALFKGCIKNSDQFEMLMSMFDLKIN